jgi:putative RecB family exonuclease
MIGATGTSAPPARPATPASAPAAPPAPPEGGRAIPPARAASAPPAHISPTAAKAYLACSLRFYFERVLRLPRPVPPALHLGKAVHAALQRFHLALWRGEDSSPGAVARAFEDAFDSL